MKYGIVNKPVITIYEGPYEVKQEPAGYVSAISDEGLYGMGIAVIGQEERGFLPVRTFYGYTGYVMPQDLRMTTEETLKEWEDSDLMVTDAFCVDILSLPKVQGVRLISLFKGSLVSVEAFESSAEGWAEVRLADGRRGYIRNQFLRKKEFSQSYLWTGDLPQKKIVDEQAFRRAVMDTAKQYLGIQYRWGGRSTAGIDCSGLTSVSYMLNGILTYRDARIVEGYPVHEISRNEMKEGDLLYFPGHIAMYLGEGKYIHSTGRIGSGGVVINSLIPGTADYREDLDKSLYAVGSIF